jgi:hypothetical protein
VGLSEAGGAEADKPTRAGARCRRRSSAADTDLVFAAARAPARRPVIDARHYTDHPAERKTSSNVAHKVTIFKTRGMHAAGYQVVEADGVPYDEEEGLTRFE